MIPWGVYLINSETSGFIKIGFMPFYAVTSVATCRECYDWHKYVYEHSHSWLYFFVNFIISEISSFADKLRYYLSYINRSSPNFVMVWPKQPARLYRCIACREPTPCNTKRYSHASCQGNLIQKIILPSAELSVLSVYAQDWQDWQLCAAKFRINALLG